MKVFLKAVFCGLLVLSLSSCSPTRMAINIAAGEMEAMVPVFEQDDDLYKLESAMPVALVGAEALLSKDPNNYKMLVQAAQLYGAYAMGFFEHKIEAKMFENAETGVEDPEILELKALISLYTSKGMGYAERALEVRNKGIIAKFNNVEAVGPAIAKLGKKDVPALFFYAFNTALYAYYNMESMQALSKIHVVESAMKRIIEIDPTYFHGLAHLALFAANARAPMLGGNLELAMDHYNKLKDIVGEDFYMADVQYARFYLYTTQDRKQFIAVLQNVLDRYKTARPQYRMFNEIAAIKARIYMKYVDQLFI